MRNCLITGAGRGIGAATAKELAGSGWRLFVNYRSNVDAAEHLLAEIREHGGEVVGCRADVSSRPEVERILATVRATTESLDCLIHNAGAPFVRRPARNLDWDRDMLPQLETSCRGLLNCLQVFQPLLHKGSLVLVMLTSALFIHDGSDTGDYLAGKGALYGLCRAWHRDLARLGVRLALVSPGATKTELLLRSFGQSQRHLELFAARLAGSGIASPEEVAKHLLVIIEEMLSAVTSEAEPVHFIVSKDRCWRLASGPREVL
jgi:3-oxoacyl-[acyl-carrier protein] reductase